MVICNNNLYIVFSNSTDVDLLIDYVQVRKAGDIFDVRAVVFPAASGGSHEAHVRVALKVDEKKDEISETKCDICTKKGMFFPRLYKTTRFNVKS